MINLAHHWLVGIRGGEKVLEQLCRLAPGAEISTLVHRTAPLGEVFKRHRVRTSMLQTIPGGSRRYKELLPLHPLAISRMRCSDSTRLLISSDAAMIKGLGVPAEAVHVCYCHSPPRYLWEMPEEYCNRNSRLGALYSAVFKLSIERCKQFDWAAAQRVDRFVANSHFVRDRIRRYYGKDSEVVYPPVDVDRFNPELPREDFYLVVSELVPYKRIDLAVRAFTRLGKRLVVIGDGTEGKRLREAAGENIQFLGRQPFAAVKHHFERCRAFIFPGVEDFGITPVEAMAAGASVIAFGKGGALETVVEGESGMFFHEQSVEGLIAAIEHFESSPARFRPDACRANAERFRADYFLTGMRDVLEKAVAAKGTRVSGINN